MDIFTGFLAEDAPDLFEFGPAPRVVDLLGQQSYVDEKTGETKRLTSPMFRGVVERGSRDATGRSVPGGSDKANRDYAARLTKDIRSQRNLTPHLDEDGKPKKKEKKPAPAPAPKPEQSAPKATSATISKDASGAVKIEPSTKPGPRTQMPAEGPKPKPTAPAPAGGGGWKQKAIWGGAAALGLTGAAAATHAVQQSQRRDAMLKKHGFEIPIVDDHFAFADIGHDRGTSWYDWEDELGQDRTYPTFRITNADQKIPLQEQGRAVITYDLRGQETRYTKNGARHGAELRVYDIEQVPDAAPQNGAEMSEFGSKYPASLGFPIGHRSPSGKVKRVDRVKNRVRTSRRRRKQFANDGKGEVDPISRARRIAEDPTKTEATRKRAAEFLDNTASKYRANAGVSAHAPFAAMGLAGGTGLGVTVANRKKQ